MEVNAELVVLAGVGAFFWALAYFAVFRRVNRPLVWVVAIAFACLGVGFGLMAWDLYQQGIAPVPSGRRTTTAITQAQHPALFSFATTILWLGTAGTLLMSAYLFSIALTRRRRK